MPNVAVTPRRVGSCTFGLTDDQGRSYSIGSDASLQHHFAFDTDTSLEEDLGPSLAGTVALVCEVPGTSSGFSLVTREEATVEPSVEQSAVGYTSRLPSGST